MNEIQTCPNRMQGGPWEIKEGLDSWIKQPNGDRTCSFCGSLHEEDFLEILEKYGNGAEGYRFSTTDKPYKKYASRPGVRNASEGGIKFYMWHMDLNTNYGKKNDLYKRAVERLIKEFQH